jgi:hypothetical protein
MVQRVSGAYSELSAFELTKRIPQLLNNPTLSKRDACADAIPGTVSQICSPGNTLCCKLALLLLLVSILAEHHKACPRIRA